MAYTEIKEKNEKKYYYRVRTMREGQKFKKKRIYLGRDLKKKDLVVKEEEADYSLNKIRNLSKLDRLKPKIIRVLKKHKVQRAGVFGSYALGNSKKNSDVDILIEPPAGIGFGFARIQQDLENVIGKKVDLVSYNGLSPFIKKKVLEQEIRII